MGIRWDARSAFPLRALAKAPYADGVVPTFFLCPRSCKHGAGVWGSGGTRSARSPYGHEHNDMLGGVVRWDARSAFPLRALAKAPYADGVMLSFFLCPRSCEHGAGCGDPVGRVPQGTRSPYGHEHNDMLEREG